MKAPSTAPAAGPERWGSPVAAGRLLRRHVAWLLALALAVGLSWGVPAFAAAAKPKQTTVDVTVNRAHPGAAVPQGFIGLSFEMSALAQIARYSDRGDLATMLRSLGPGVLRFGGVSADTRIAWTDTVTPRPSWATNVVDVDDFRELAGLASASGWHIVLTVGFVHFEPTAAAREVAAAKAALGESLVGIEIGNEPNSYAQHAMRVEPWDFAHYASEVAAYRGAIEAAAPGIPLYGPDVSGSSAFESWGPGEAVVEQPAMLTGHHYPLGCEQRPPPSITRLLSPQIRSKEVGSLRRYTTLSRAANLPFRLDETNSVSCGGVAGISNTFASALWAAGFLPEVMASGAVGVNMHGNPTNCKGYSPVCALGPQELSTGSLLAQPEWYSLLIARELIGVTAAAHGDQGPPASSKRAGLRLSGPRWQPALRARRLRPARAKGCGRAPARRSRIHRREHARADRSLARFVGRHRTGRKRSCSRRFVEPAAHRQGFRAPWDPQRAPPSRERSAGDRLAGGALQRRSRAGPAYRGRLALGRSRPGQLSRTRRQMRHAEHLELARRSLQRGDTGVAILLE